MSIGKPSKREMTRQKVIEAAIDSIYKEGFNAAHTNKIAKQAGVSWGVLQYHFGDKDTLLQAVLDTIFEQFFTTMSEVSLDGEDLHSRVGQLIDVIWGLVSRKEYRVSVAILRNAGKDQDSKINGQKQIKQWADEMSDLWHKLLEDDIDNNPMGEATRHLLFATLRGLADDINPRANPAKNLPALERGALVDAITYLLTKQH